MKSEVKGTATSKRLGNTGLYYDARSDKHQIVHALYKIRSFHSGRGKNCLYAGKRAQGSKGK